MPQHTTREAWLLAAVQLLKPIFAAKHHVVPHDCQVSCGFASTGTRSHHIGQCWSRRSSTHDRNQIFISPALGDPVEVLDTLVHELVHAVDNCEHKHGKEFKKIALSVGLEGPMRSAGAGKALKEKLTQIAAELGPYRTIADITRARIDKVIAKLQSEHPDKTTDLACAHFTLPGSTQLLVRKHW